MLMLYNVHSYNSIMYIIQHKHELKIYYIFVHYATKCKKYFSQFRHVNNNLPTVNLCDEYMQQFKN